MIGNSASFLIGAPEENQSPSPDNKKIKMKLLKPIHFDKH